MKPVAYMNSLIEEENNKIARDQSVRSKIALMLEKAGFEVSSLEVREYRPSDGNGNYCNYRQLDISVKSLQLSEYTYDPFGGWPV